MHLVEPHIVKRLIKGDQLAFNYIYDKLSNGIFSVSMQIIDDKAVAEEVVQEVFIKLWTNKAKLQEDSNLWVFLYVVAKRLSLNKVRSAKRQQLREEHWEYSSDTQRAPDEEIFYRELEQVIHRTIMDLPYKQRMVIELSRNEGLTHAQIAEKLGISSNTVKNHLYLALSRIRKKLNESNIYVLFTHVGFF